MGLLLFILLTLGLFLLCAGFLLGWYTCLQVARTQAYILTSGGNKEQKVYLGPLAAWKEIMYGTSVRRRNR